VPGGVRQLRVAHCPEQFATDAHAMRTGGYTDWARISVVGIVGWDSKLDQPRRIRTRECNNRTHAGDISGATVFSQDNIIEATRRLRLTGRLRDDISYVGFSKTPPLPDLDAG
jgi:hypothetical protein